MDVDPGKFSDGALEILLEGLCAAPEEVIVRDSLLKIFAAERDRRASHAGGEIPTTSEVTELSLSDLEPEVTFSILTDTPLWMILVQRGFVRRQIAGELADPQDLKAVSDFLTRLATELRLATRRRSDGIFRRRRKKFKIN